MKNPIEHLNKIFDSRIRLGIMSALMVNAEVNFNELKELVAVRYGNQFFQLIKIDLRIDHQGAHNAQSNTAVEYFIEMFYRILHVPFLKNSKPFISAFITFPTFSHHFLSYLHHITAPYT